MAQGKSALGIVRKYYPQVTRILEAKKDLTILVTTKDSRSSTKKSPNACALATACEREYDGAIISLSVAYLIKGNKAMRYRVPGAIAREIVSFDRHQDFQPGQYKLNAPSESGKLHPLGRKLRANRKGGGFYGGDKRRVHRTAGIRSL